MCKIDNVNKNKTADICFYYYIDEIIYVVISKKKNPHALLSKKNLATPEQTLLISLGILSRVVKFIQLPSEQLTIATQKKKSTNVEKCLGETIFYITNL